MKNETEQKIEALRKKLSRIVDIEKQDLALAKERTKKIKELKRRLLKYQANTSFNNEFVCITLENYDNILKFDPEASILIADLGMKIQFKAL